MTLQWPLLSPLGEGERREVLSRCSRRRFAKGEALVRSGDAGDSLHLIAAGSVAIRVSTPVGDVATIDILGPGDAFGEQALISGDEGRTATAVALEPSETLRLSQAEFGRLLAERPGVLRFLVELLDARLRATTQDLLDALYLPVETRVYRRLSKLARIYANRDGIPITQDDLASMVGTTRQSLNKVLRTAQDEGIVTLARGQISVTDHDAVVRRAR